MSESISSSINGGQTVSRDALVGLGAQRLAEVLLEQAMERPDLLGKLSDILRSTTAMSPQAEGVSGSACKPGPRNARPPETDDADEAEPYMIGNSPVIREIYDLIRRFAETDAPILITGESGTGKELAAQAIHERSRYAGGPFVPINCAALPPSLIASELFGNEKGAFTGAAQRRIGRIESAAGGTVFLDEIGDLPLELQGHLLRFLQDGTIDRIGGHRPIHVNVRVVAATNADLSRAVRNGDFREDLFYRLNVLAIELPPLRDRGEDTEVLARFFLRRFAEEMGFEAVDLDDHAQQAIRLHHWPGNVRELIACMRRGVVMAKGPLVTAKDLGLLHVLDQACPGEDAKRAGNTSSPGDRTPEKRAPQSGSAWRGAGAPPSSPQPQPARSDGGDGSDNLPSLEEARYRAEEQVLQRALEASNRNVKKAAEGLGVSRVTLYRLMEKHGLGRHVQSTH